MQLDREIYPFDAQTELTVSRRPTALIAALADQFESPAWATVEETVAAALPHLLLAANPADRTAWAKRLAGEGADDEAMVRKFESQILRDAQDRQAEALKAIRSAAA